MKWRCSNGFRSSIGTVLQGMYPSSAFAAGLFAALRTVLFFATFRLDLAFAPFAISVHLPLIDCNRIIMQVPVRQLQSLCLGYLAL